MANLENRRPLASRQTGWAAAADEMAGGDQHHAQPDFHRQHRRRRDRRRRLLGRRRFAGHDCPRAAPPRRSRLLPAQAALQPLRRHGGHRSRQERARRWLLERVSRPRLGPADPRRRRLWHRPSRAWLGGGGARHLHRLCPRTRPQLRAARRLLGPDGQAAPHGGDDGRRARLDVRTAAGAAATTSCSRRCGSWRSARA